MQRLLSYLTLMVGLTWLFWIPAAFLEGAALNTPLLVLYFLGGVTPALVTVILVLRDYGPAQQHRFWARVVDLRRIGLAWYGLILLTPPLLAVMAGMVDRSLGGPGLNMDPLTAFLSAPLSLLGVALFMLVLGPLPEEIAWRGYALDVARPRLAAAVAAVVIGLYWTVWHLPLFWVEGTYQHGLGMGTPAFWLYMLDKVPQSLVMVWICVNNRYSIAAAVLLHFMVNFTGEVTDLTIRGQAVTILLWYLLAMGALKSKRWQTN